MTELYLRLLDRVLTPTLLVLALLLFLRGHDLPGGGFIAGLVAAAAIQLHILGTSVAATDKALGSRLLPLVGWGLLIAVTSAIIGLSAGGFFKGVWVQFTLGAYEIKIGTPVTFDLGVGMVVVGMAVTYLLRLAEQSNGGDAEGQP
jgi:multicomponent Na+:H+ antiporter subunit B